MGSNLDWFWGPKNYTSTLRLGNGVTWLLQGIQAAGPDLTPKNFLQGQFHGPRHWRIGEQHAARLHDRVREDHRSSLQPVQPIVEGDFSVMWLAPDIAAPDSTGVAKKPSLQFLNGGQRYRGGTWPTKKLPFFDQSKSIGSFDTAPPGYAVPVRTACSGCPSSGALSPKPGTPSQDGFVVPVPASTSS